MGVPSAWRMRSPTLDLSLHHRPAVRFPQPRPCTRELLPSRSARGLEASATNCVPRDASLVSANGQKAVVPGWDLQSTAKAGKDLAALSKSGVDTSSWYHVKESRCTLMGCLLDLGIYNDTSLFYSNNLASFNSAQFLVPWVYRKEFALAPSAGQHFFVETNGITSKADIYANGKQIADKVLQSGSYGGHTYDVTDAVAKSNALVIQTYPTDYNYDFAEGFVDWNPTRRTTEPACGVMSSSSRPDPSPWDPCAW